MKRLSVLVVPFDALAVLAAVASVTIAATGGGRLEVMGHTIRAHSVGNSLLFVGLWVAVRYLLRHIPLLGIASLPLDHLPSRALTAVLHVADTLDRLTARESLVFVVVVAGCVAVLKAALVFSHVGFFSGDDVEIHEMTLMAIFSTNWPIWDLRSSFYPMLFIYPAQHLAWYSGVTDTTTLVAIGRLVVVMASTATILVLYRIALARHGVPTALIASLLLATSSLHVEFGASELPRPVAALFVLWAYASLTRPPRVGAAAAAGILLGIASCFRFSEAVFIIPALLHLVLTRRWKHAMVTLLLFLATAGAIQALSDYWYWGAPFQSARAVVDFTLIDRLSSRGYEPWWYYAQVATSWSDLLVIALAVYATRHNPMLALWVWLPIACLSALAHKEPRYLIPVVPLLSLLAARGFWTLSQWLRPRATSAVAGAVALCIVVGTAMRLVDQVSKYRIVRSDREVRFAQTLAPTLSAESIMVERAWRFGGHLYLGHGRSVVDFGPDDLARRTLRNAIARTAPAVLLVSDRTCQVVDCGPSLASLGFVETTAPGLDDLGYRMFQRSNREPS